MTKFSLGFEGMSYGAYSFLEVCTVWYDVVMLTSLVPECGFLGHCGRKDCKAFFSYDLGIYLLGKNR